jgi:hypothetical protein
MSADGWWRFYNSAPHNPKLLKLSDKQYRLWTNLLSFASAHGGSLPPTEDVAAALRMPVMKLERAIEELIDAKLLDRTETEIRPHNWDRRQYKSDVSTERVKRFRERERNGGGTPSGNVSETPPEYRIQKQKEETSLRSEKNGASAPPTQRRKQRLPQDWEPKPEDNDVGYGLGLTEPELEQEFAKFTDWAAANNALKSSWNATWRNWQREAAERKSRGKAQGNGLVGRAH